MIDDLWYKNAVIYNLNVGTFMDSNGDGIGDFEGLSRRLDYLSGLGITCIWLQPFQPSPISTMDTTSRISTESIRGMARPATSLTSQIKPGNAAFASSLISL
jgi:hypothetical protein